MVYRRWTSRTDTYHYYCWCTNSCQHHSANALTSRGCISSYIRYVYKFSAPQLVPRAHDDIIVIAAWFHHALLLVWVHTIIICWQSECHHLLADWRWNSWCEWTVPCRQVTQWGMMIHALSLHCDYMDSDFDLYMHMHYSQAIKMLKSSDSLVLTVRVEQVSVVWISML